MTPGTQGSSASTFGVPTTPKTTPFMTPTPLSPSHLSPIGSDANLDVSVESSHTEQPQILIKFDDNVSILASLVRCSDLKVSLSLGLLYVYCCLGLLHTFDASGRPETAATESTFG